MLFLTHVLGLLLTVVVSLATAYWVHQQAGDRAGTVMVALLLSHAAMATFVLAELLSPTLGLATFWTTLWYTLVLVNPVLWLLLAVYYTGREDWLTKPVRVLLFACVAVPAILVFTNSIHELLLVDLRFEPEPFRHKAATLTDFNNALFVLANVNVLLSAGLFLQMFLVSRRSARTHTGAILVGMTAITVPAYATIAGYTPIQTFPYGIFGAGIYGVVVAVALFRTRLFAVAPLARDVLFESIDEALVVVDARHAIVDFNEAARTALPELGSHLGDRLDDEFPAFVERADSVTDGGGAEAVVERVEGTLDSPFASKVRITNEEGTREIRVGISEISSGGEPRGYALILRDVTELETYATRLERKSEQLERFASTLSHDLRNPVSIALGYLELELENEREDLGNVREAKISIERIEETIEDLLTLSRQGDRIDGSETVSLRTVANEAWATSDTGDATFENDVEPAYHFRADRSRLQTVLENVFRNAVDHGGTTVCLTRIDGGFAVGDNGPGIPVDEREQVFEYGYSTHADGTGFGLAIVASIAGAHGWTIEVTESEAGGAQFEVTGVDRVVVSTA